MKLQWKILLPIVGLLMILLSVNGYMNYTQSSTALRNALLGDMRNSAEAILRATQRVIDGSLANTSVIAGNTIITNTVDEVIAPYSATNYLTQVMRDYEELDYLALINAQGGVMAASTPEVEGKNYSNHDFVKKALAGTPSFSVPLIDQYTNKGAILLATPVTSSGKVTGAVISAFSLERYYDEILRPVKFGQTGYAYAADAEGRVFAFSNKEVLFKDNYPLNRELKAFYVDPASSGNSYVANTRGEPQFAYYAQNRDYNLLVVVSAAPEDVFAPLDEIMKTSIIVSAVTLLLASATVYLVTLPIVRALSRSADFADAVAHSGNLHAVLDIKRNDEIGVLAAALSDIPKVLLEVIEEYHRLKYEVEHGNIGVTSDPSKFNGEFADLIGGTNAILTQFRNIVDSIPSPVVMLSADQRAVYLNKVAKDVAGSDFMGKSCKELFAREDSGTEQCALLKSLASHHAVSAETRAHPQGKDMDISYTAIPLYESGGKLAAVLQLITDLTEIKSAQRTIMQVADQAHAISNRVATAATQLSAQVEQVNGGTDIQRERAASTATAMEEMNSTVLEVARNAAQASKQADDTSKKAREGAGLVTQVIEAIKNVNDVAVELEQNIQELGQQAESIGEVMNVISDIADQTNLLALNAAIEAARAGDAGRGFAVVADEVRKLAENTMKATNEVGSRIRAIQESTASNITRVANAATGVNKATGLAATSGAALSEILEFANANSLLITGIATAAEEQSATSEEINQSIDEINRIAGETADGMGESALAVNELSQMAQELRTLLDRLQ